MNDKDKNDKRKSKPLPLWSKTIITFTSLGIALVMATIITSMIGVRDMVNLAQNPVYMEEVAQSIAAFPRPLPQGYKYFCAFDVGGMVKILAVDYADGKRRQQIMLVSYMIDNQNPEEQIDPSKVVKEVYSKYGLNTFLVQRKFTNIETEGCWTIQGFIIPYQIGRLQGVKGTGLVACLVNELQKKVIVFHVAQLDGINGNASAGGNSKVVSVNESTAGGNGKDKPAADGTIETATGGTGTVGAGTTGKTDAGTTGTTGAGTTGATGAGTTGTTGAGTTGTTGAGTSGTTGNQPEPFDMRVITNLLQDVKGF